MGAGPVTIETCGAGPSRGGESVGCGTADLQEGVCPLGYSGEHLEGTECFLVKESYPERGSTQGIFFLTGLEAEGPHDKE